MTEWIDVADAETLAPGDFEVVESGDTLIAVFNIDGQFCAIEDICTHDGEELTGGPPPAKGAWQVSMGPARLLERSGLGR